MRKNTDYIIMSYQAESKEFAFGELLTADGLATEELVLDGECALYSTHIGFAKLALLFRKNPPVFIRHIHPVMQTIDLTGEASDLPLLCSAADALPFEPCRFSVQCRIIGKNESAYKPFDINSAVSEILKGKGGVLDVKNPTTVLSLTLYEGKAYMGISSAADNLSSWSGGRVRYMHTDDQLSRAEFKLLEAQDTFGFSIFEGARVLDLGAAPGGWTRVALEKGAVVTAVDPALLSEKLAGAANLIHKRETAQEYLEHAEGGYDFILNDMRMEAEASAQLVTQFHPYLKEGGTVVLTVKLQTAQPKKQLNKALKTVGNYYDILNVRQLFHNRSEVTVLLRKQ